eukprot:1479253-Alexandrium_andersonii.AAC.1
MGSDQQLRPEHPPGPRAPRATTMSRRLQHERSERATTYPAQSRPPVAEKLAPARVRPADA